jgi:hypothetical protein
MLIEFRVKNFRSLRDEQVLSLVASKDKTLRDSNTQATGLKAMPNLLCSAAVYGFRSSGKSNLVKALQYMRAVVINSAGLQSGQAFGRLRAFRLDAQSEQDPTEFEVTFILANEAGEKARYQYGFAMTSQRIVREHLWVHKSSKAAQRWFERHFDAETGEDVCHFGSALKGIKTKWKEAARPNALLLSIADQLNTEVLQPVFDWFVHQLVIINELSPLLPQFLARMIKQDEQRQELCGFLGAADIGIVDLDVVTRKVVNQSVQFDLMTGKWGEVPVEQEIDEIKFRHRSEQGDVEFDLMDESSATRNLIFLGGAVLAALNEGLTLVIDELDARVHESLIRYLVQPFHRPEVNPQGAQLIFTAHGIASLDVSDLFRRDQVWAMKKGCHDRASVLTRLTKFISDKPDKNETADNQNQSR